MTSENDEGVVIGVLSMAISYYLVTDAFGWSPNVLALAIGCLIPTLIRSLWRWRKGRTQVKHRHDWHPQIPNGNFPGVYMSVLWTCECGATKRESLWVHS